MSAVTEILQAKVNPAVSFRTVETEMRRRNYGILSTVARNGRPHSTSVTYAVSARSRPLALYIVTDRRSKKARNIGRNPNVAFVVPVPRSPGFLPPASIQFQGTAEIVPVTDETAQKAFNASFVLRMILKAQFAQKREVSIFVRIRPDALVFTYGVGATLFRLMKHVEGASARVEIPAARLEQGTGPET